MVAFSGADEEKGYPVTKSHPHSCVNSTPDLPSITECQLNPGRWASPRIPQIKGRRGRDRLVNGSQAGSLWGGS